MSASDVPDGPDVPHVPELLERVVPAALDGVRLDRALAELIVGVSRAELARWVSAGQVEVTGVEHPRPSSRVRAGAAMRIVPLPPPSTTAVPDPNVPFTILYEDEAIVVVDKPAGVVVHPAHGHWTGTLVNGLLARGPLAPADPRDTTPQPRPGIVHRIDKDTSGVLVVARTALARERLKSAFSAHAIERVYDAAAVEEGHPLPARATYDTNYGRHPTDRRAFTGRPRSEGKRAVTHVVVVERFVGACLIECRLETGRTHQIRVHLAEAGAPLLADPLYGRAPRSPELRAIASSIGRHALHARVLGFAHPMSGRAMRFESPWPDDFQAAIDALRSLAPR